MVSTFKARIPTQRGCKALARGGFHAYGKPADKAPGRERMRRDRGNLNQYTAVGSFEPEFDAAGKAADGCKADWTHAQRAPRRGESAMGRARINQPRVQTSTGIWNVSYNAENRPTIFIRENEDGTQTRITCAYDYMGRRARKKVETIAADSTATVNENRLFIYRGYLQIACCGLMETSQPCRWFLIWDPTQPVATRPLAIRKDGTWYCYGWDLTKNICEVFGADGLIKTSYSYTPYGAVTASGTVTQSPRGIGGGLDNSTAVTPQGRTADGVAVSQPIQWSSEFYDEEMGLVYYNYRHYNTNYGRWMGRDYLSENIGLNLFAFVDNKPSTTSDILGLVKLIYASKSCRLIALFLIKFEFVESMYIPKGLYGQDYDTFYGKPWSSSQKEAYKNKVYISLRKKWNNQKSLVSVSPDCCCKTLKLQLAIDETSTSQEDFIIQVIRTDWPFFRAFQWGERVFLDTSTTGNTISHEFGHTIGLMHPNAGKIDPNTGKVFEANSPQEYESIDGKDIYGRDVSENDLMGKNPINSIMRDFYYDRDWKNPINAFLPNCKYEYKQ